MDSNVTKTDVSVPASQACVFDSLYGIPVLPCVEWLMPWLPDAKDEVSIVKIDPAAHKVIA